MRFFSWASKVSFVFGAVLLGGAAYFVALLFSGKGGLGGIFALIGLFVNAIALALIAIIAGLALRFVSRRHGKKKRD